MRNKRVIVARRSTGVPGKDTFELVEGPGPECPRGGMTFKVMLATVDPGMRGRVSTEVNYHPVATGATMEAQGIGEVIESDHPDWQAGDLAYGEFGWQQFAAVAPDAVRNRVDTTLAPIEKWTSALGLNGIAAWLGLNRYGRPEQGETIVVTTAAGSVGSIVGQLARAKGLRTVGLTGNAGKVAIATRQFGYDAAIDYTRSAELVDALKSACPGGVDVFFDTVSGSVSDAVFGLLNLNARVVQCGTSSVSDWTSAPLAPRRERAMLQRRLSWSGFVVFDHEARYAEARAELAALLKEEKLSTREHILTGLEQAPGAIEMLYAGANDGRLLIRP